MMESEGKGDPFQIDKAAVIINRGWIPYQYKDKKSRPWETNSTKLVQVRGVWRAGKDIHDYKIPNNPDNNEWHNIALEDIALYWELPNFCDCKYYYFESIDLNGEGGFRTGNSQNDIAPLPLPNSRDQLIDDYYKFKVKDTINQTLFRGFGVVSVASALMTFFAI